MWPRGKWPVLYLMRFYSRLFLAGIVSKDCRSGCGRHVRMWSIHRFAKSPKCGKELGACIGRPAVISIMLAFLAFGTRGDVQPLAVLSEHLRRTSGRQTIVLITHLAHRCWLSEEPFGLLPVLYIGSPPCGSSEQDRVLEEYAQHGACWDAMKGLQQLSMVVFNLFALEVGL